MARVIDFRTGELLTTHQLTTPTGHFINDVTLLGDRAWFTDFATPSCTASRAAAVPARSAPPPHRRSTCAPADAISANGVVDTSTAVP